MMTETATVEVWEQQHNGSNWETIPGAAWDMKIRPGESFRDACIRHGGEFSATEVTRLVTFDEDGAVDECEDFKPGEL